MEPTEDLPGERDGDLPETRPGEEPDGPGPGERAGDGDAPGGAGERHRDVSEPLVFLLAAGEVARREGEREAGRSEDDDSNDAELVRRRACRPATPNILLLHHRYLYVIINSAEQARPQPCRRLGIRSAWVECPGVPWGGAPGVCLLQGPGVKVPK